MHSCTCRAGYWHSDRHEMWELMQDVRGAIRQAWAAGKGDGKGKGKGSAGKGNAPGLAKAPADGQRHWAKSAPYYR
jgi:hypothetical protein